MSPTRSTCAATSSSGAAAHWQEASRNCVSRYSGSAPPYRARFDEMAKVDYGEVSLS